MAYIWAQADLGSFNLLLHHRRVLERSHLPDTGSPSALDGKRLPLCPILTRTKREGAARRINDSKKQAEEPIFERLQVV